MPGGSAAAGYNLPGGPVAEPVTGPGATGLVLRQPEGPLASGQIAETPGGRVRGHHDADPAQHEQRKPRDRSHGEQRDAAGRSEQEHRRQQHERRETLPVVERAMHDAARKIQKLPHDRLFEATGLHDVTRDSEVIRRVGVAASAGVHGDDHEPRDRTDAEHEGAQLGWRQAGHVHAIGSRTPNCVSMSPTSRLLIYTGSIRRPCQSTRV